MTKLEKNTTIPDLKYNNVTLQLQATLYYSKVNINCSVFLKITLCFIRKTYNIHLTIYIKFISHTYKNMTL